MLNLKYLSEVNQLFYTLFQNKGRLTFKEHPELFKLYRNPEAIPYIKQFEEDFCCQIIAVQQETLFLQATLENEVFSLSEAKIKELTKGKTRMDAYLTYYACLVVLNLIYLPHITCEELQNRFTTTDAVSAEISERLLAAVEKAGDVEFLQENQQSSSPLIHEIENIELIYRHWESKLGGEGRGIVYKNSFVNTVFQFLSEQELIRVVPTTLRQQAYGTDRLYAVMQVIRYQERDRLMAKFLGAVDWTRQPEFKEEEQRTYNYLKQD